VRERIGHDGPMAALVRPRTGRVIGGVCVAIANRFEMSATVIRVLMAGSIVFFGLSIGLYLLLWLLIPLERD
jgi:phage shock protein C